MVNIALLPFTPAPTPKTLYLIYVDKDRLIVSFCLLWRTLCEVFKVERFYFAGNRMVTRKLDDFSAV